MRCCTCTVQDSRSVLYDSRSALDMGGRQNRNPVEVQTRCLKDKVSSSCQDFGDAAPHIASLEIISKTRLLWPNPNPWGTPYYFILARSAEGNFLQISYTHISCTSKLICTINLVLELDPQITTFAHRRSLGFCLYFEWKFKAPKVGCLECCNSRSFLCSEIYEASRDLSIGTNTKGSPGLVSLYYYNNSWDLLARMDLYLISQAIERINSYQAFQRDSQLEHL
jgi:hypothetical protein